MLLEIILVLAIFAIYGYVIYRSCKGAESNPNEVAKEGIKIPSEHATERLNEIKNVNEKHVYDSIRADINFNVPICAYGCTGEQLIHDLGDSAPSYEVVELDRCNIRNFSVSLLRYTPLDDSYFTFYELKITKQ